MLHPGRPSTLALVGLAALALGIRVYGLGARDLWENEQVTLVDSLGVRLPVAEGKGRSFPSSRLHTDKGPLAIARYSASHDQPIYVTLMCLWTRLVPSSEWSLRLPSALMGALTIPVLAVLGARLLGNRGGLWAAALLAVLPLHVSYSQEARTYATTIFLVVLSAAVCLAVGERDDRWSWIGYGIVAATVPAFHLLAAVALLPQGAWLLARPGSGRRLPYALASGFFVLCLLTPLGYGQSVITAHRESGIGFQHPPPELRDWALPTTFSRLVSGLGATTTRLLGIEYPGFGVRARDVLWLSGPLLAAVIVAARRMRPRKVALFLIGAASLPLMTAAILSLGYGHIVPLQDRYSAWSMPFFALLLGESIVRLRNSLSRLAGTALLLTCGLFLAKMQIPAPPRTTPRAHEIERLTACALEGQVVRANDAMEAAVISSWTKGPLLLQVSADPASSQRTAWEVEPGTGTLCRTSSGTGCDGEFPLCP